MKIGVVGCGALGSYYGAKLRALGEEVHFLLRSDYEAVKRAGVEVRSPDGDFRVQPIAARDPESIGRCDLVLIGLKTTANDEFPRLLRPLVGSSTAVITLQNGLGNEERLAKLFGPDQILGGRCFVCLNRIAPGVIQHSAHGDIILGEYHGTPRARTEELAKMFQRAGVRCRLSANLEKTNWEKLVWNIPFNGLGVAAAAGYDAVINGELLARSKLGPCLTTDKLLEDPRWTHLVRELMGEVVAGAAKLGYEIRAEVIEDRINSTRRMGAYKASTLIDFERGQPLELESMFLEPLRQAKRAGASVPRLRGLCNVLAALDPGKNVAAG